MPNDNIGNARRPERFGLEAPSRRRGLSAGDKLFIGFLAFAIVGAIAAAILFGLYPDMVRIHGGGS